MLSGYFCIRVLIVLKQNTQFSAIYLKEFMLLVISVCLAQKVEVIL